MFSCAPREKFRGVKADLLMFLGCALLTGEGYVFMILGMPLVIADFPVSAVADLILYPIEGFWEDEPSWMTGPPKPEPAHSEGTPGTGVGPLVRVGERSSVRALEVSPDASSLLVATESRSVRLWNVKSAQVLWEIEDRAVGSVAFSAEGETIALLRDDNRVVWLVDTRSGAQRRELALGQVASPPPLAFSADGATIYAGNEAFSVETGASLGRIPGIAPGGTVVAAAPDGSLFATVVGAVGEGRIEIVDATGTRRLSYTVRGAVHGVAFSPSGSYVAVATAGSGESPSDTLEVFRTDKDDRRWSAVCPRNARVLAFSAHNDDQVAAGGAGALVVL